MRHPASVCREVLQAATSGGIAGFTRAQAAPGLRHHKSARSGLMPGGGAAHAKAVAPKSIGCGFLDTYNGAQLRLQDDGIVCAEIDNLTSRIGAKEIALILALPAPRLPEMMRDGIRRNLDTSLTADRAVALARLVRYFTAIVHAATSIVGAGRMECPVAGTASSIRFRSSLAAGPPFSRVAGEGHSDGSPLPRPLSRKGRGEKDNPGSLAAGPPQGEMTRGVSRNLRQSTHWSTP